MPGQVDMHRSSCEKMFTCWLLWGKCLFVEFLLIDKLSLGGIHYGIRPIVKVGCVYCDAACCARYVLCCFLRSVQQGHDGYARIGWRVVVQVYGQSASVRSQRNGFYAEVLFKRDGFGRHAALLVSFPRRWHSKLSSAYRSPRICGFRYCQQIAVVFPSFGGVLHQQKMSMLMRCRFGECNNLHLFQQIIFLQ